MKLIIQIPCYNEEKSLPITLSELPRTIDNIDIIEWLIIDDGSTDDTIKIAKDYGVDHIVCHHRNLGLAKAFKSGLEASIKHGADIIVNTDADNQYSADNIQDIILPILNNEAEIVIGARPIDQIPHFSKLKKMLQKLGSWVVRKASTTNISDATSGFRAFSRKAASKINVFSSYTYTLETIIQAGQKDIPIKSVPVKVNDDLRKSRLLKSIPSYIYKSILTILRIFIVYKPFKFFITFGLLLLFFAFILGLRFLFFYFTGEGEGHIQSLILANILFGMGFQLIVLAFIADLLSVNRKLLEKIDTKLNELKE